MADVALNAGIEWKRGKVLGLLSYALEKLFEHASDPSSLSQLPDDLALVDRYARELDTLDGDNKGRAWDLVKRNLQSSIENARAELQRWLGFLATAPSTLRYRDETERLRQNLADLERKLQELEAEGRPPG